MPGAHKIGAAISGSRITGGKITNSRPSLATKTPREVFLGKCCLQKYVSVFSCLCTASCQGIYRPSHEKNSLRIIGPFWRRVILDIWTRHMLRLNVHPPWQEPSAQRKRFSTRCICTQTFWGDLLCFVRRSVVVYCEEMFLGQDLWWGFFGGIFWWDFSRLFLRETSPKSPSAEKIAPQNLYRPSQNPWKICTPNPQKKTAPKKSVWRIHSHMSVQKSQPPPKQTPANQYQRRLWAACPTWRLICHVWRRPLPVLHRPHPNQ